MKKLGVWIVAAFLLGCGPEQSNIEKEKELMQENRQKVIDRFKPAEGYFQSVRVNGKPNTLFTLSIVVVVETFWDASRSTELYLVRLNGMLRTGEGSIPGTPFFKGDYDPETKRLNLYDNPKGVLISGHLEGDSLIFTMTNVTTDSKIEMVRLDHNPNLPKEPEKP